MFCIDLETTVNGGPEGDSPEAQWLNNKVLLCGWSRDPYSVPQVETNVHALCSAIQTDIKNMGHAWVAAHNAKFDLKYLMRESPKTEWHKVRVWDTMTFEYLHSGHEQKFMSLEAACASRGIPFKKGLDLGALLSQGVKMEDIPTKELTDYLIDDVLALQKLYLSQVTQQHDIDMDYILPLCEMELNGLPVDRTKATNLGTKLAIDVEIHQAAFIHHLLNHCQWQDGTPLTPEDFSEHLGTKSKTIKPMANRTLSFLLFEQPTQLKVTEKWRVCYKPNHSSIFLPSSFLGKLGVQGYPMGEDALGAIQKYYGTHPLITAMLEYRGKNKLLGTYVMPFLNTSSVQGNIYPKLNTTVTNTGRLSSSNPNGQNQPPPARELIKAAPGNEIVEIDFKQLEIVGAATLSGDPMMIADLNAGEDLHFNTGQRVMKWKTPADMTKEQRTLVKNVNFGVLYGGKAAGLSAQTGVDKALVQSLIDSFYGRYPRIAAWQKEVFEAVFITKYPYDIKNGEQRYASMYTLPNSNRKFCFVENESPNWMRQKSGRGFSFSPQHTANYPIQGFAGGDLVMSALHYLWVAVHVSGAAGFIKFRMTVHDSIVLEVKKGVNLSHILDKMCEYVVNKYNLPVALHVDVESGDYWQ